MKKLLTLALVLALCLAVFSACQEVYTQSGVDIKVISEEDATAELNALLKNVKVSNTTAPIDIADDDVSVQDALADINSFPLTVVGTGEINLKIAADTEMSSDPPDDWMNVLAKQFNGEDHQYNGKKVTVSVRQITGGEVATYMRAGAYKPDLYVPSHAGWGKMLDASGIQTKTLCDRLLGNTAGILISDKVYDDFLAKYGEASIKTVVEATIKGDLTFAYTNPYTSSTGLNMLTMILKAFDPENPLSEKASSKLIEYQKTAPPTAYTTAVMKNKAAKGIINAMVMEEQAYVLTKELSSYHYIPAGIRHDHPVFTFDYVSEEKQKAAQLFIDYCLTDKAQKLGTDKGFNRHDEYPGEDPGIDGHGYLEAQALWKQNKNGGKPVIAVFVADTSGSMDGERIHTLKQSLIATAPYIGSENYIGLVSYSDNVTVNLPIDEFTPTQKAKFTGAVKALSANGGTATYDATLQGLKMLLDKRSEIQDAKLMMFVLTDGEQNVGTAYSRIRTIVKSLQIPVYTIAYNTESTDEMKELSEMNEAAPLEADTQDIVNQLRNLFNTQL
ncbi:MAG: VWA domain-containing protein [Oscillospiraceae bacterium]|nr:VWA domain-containing protein [Oscillospiraceae bacterium]